MACGKRCSYRQETDNRRRRLLRAGSRRPSRRSTEKCEELARRIWDHANAAGSIARRLIAYGVESGNCKSPAHVRIRSDSDFGPRLSNVGSSLNSGPTVAAAACRFRANSGSRRSRSRKSCGDGPRRLLLNRTVKGRQSRATCQAISFASLQLATTRNYDLAVESRPGPGAVIVRIALRPRRHTGRKLVTVRPGASRLKRRPRPGVCAGGRLLPPLAGRLLIGMRY